MSISWEAIVLLFLLIMNGIAFAAMGIDKSKAIHGKWRISEKTLMLLAVFGGSLGGISGMYFFHHKTKTKKFVLGFPLVLIVQISVLCLLFFKIFGGSY